MAKANKETGKKQPREEYPVHTGQETKAVLCALSDGKSGRYWENNDAAAVRIHQAPGAKHRVQLRLTDDERDEGLTVQNLEILTGSRDADEDFMLLYISQQLVPAQPLPENTRAAATIDLDDIIRGIGWNPLTTVQRANMRRRIWEFIKVMTRLEITGERSIKYYDRLTGREIDTFIDSPPWMLEQKQFPEDAQPSLFAGNDEVPLKVTVVASEIWTAFTTSPRLAQYLPAGEVLGAIPGGKPAGAWARVIGLALCDFWRRHPRAATSGSLKPTRRELLEFCTPATGPVEEVLKGANPRRAIEYWAGALRILVECGFLANQGEAALTYEQQRDALTGYKWKENWLNGTTEVHPGSAMGQAITGCAEALPELKPQDLSKPKRRKRLKTVGN